MWVALMLTATVCQFKMRRSVIQIGLMYQIFLYQLCQSSVNRRFIWGFGADFVGDLFLRKRGVGFQQNLKDCQSRLCLAKRNRFQ
jgi:hypothetical protein